MIDYIEVYNTFPSKLDRQLSNCIDNNITYYDKHKYYYKYKSCNKYMIYNG